MPMKSLINRIVTASLTIGMIGFSALPASASDSNTLPANSVRYPQQSTSWQDIAKDKSTTLSVTQTSSYVSSQADTNNTLIASYQPSSVEHLHTPIWGLVNHPYQVSVPDYGWVSVDDYGWVVVPNYDWVKIGDYLPVVDPSRKLKHNSYFLTYLYAGNTIKQSGYGAHNQTIQYNGENIYWWFDNRCSDYGLVTPNYGTTPDGGDLIPGIGGYGGGFNSLAVNNPYTAQTNPTYYARAGTLGGDPLMRWNGPSGFGWYYECYATTTYEWQQVGSSTVWQKTGSHPEWQQVGSHTEWRNNYVNEIVGYNDTINSIASYDPAASMAKPNVVGVDNTSILTLRCTNTNENITLGTFASAPYDPRMRLDIVQGTGSSTDTLKVVSSAGVILEQAQIPSSCYHHPSDYTNPSGTPASNPIRPS